MPQLTCRVAIAGFGPVGRATAELLLGRRGRYMDLYGVDCRLVAVCGSRAGAHNDDGLDLGQLTALRPGLSGPDFIASSRADVLIEAGPSDFRTGGPGLDYLRSSLAAGRHAVVISKGALVHDGVALRQLARSTGAMLKISGATAAALPTIDLIDYNLKGCRVLRIEGVLNATTNYLLNAMMTRGLGFETALAEAQAGGFAERDPSYDVEGWDTACKLLILANFGLGLELRIDDMSVQGIQAITRNDLEGWRASGMVPRLGGRLTMDSGPPCAEVGIRTYPNTDPLAHVAGKSKAIRVTTDTMGEIVAIGGGAEPGATAAAALKDLEHILQARLHAPS